MRKEAVDLYQKLTNEWNKKPQNFEKCLEYLTQLKIILSETGFIPTPGSPIDKREIHLARDVFEIGAQCSIAVGDIHGFERYISQLKTFYFDFQNEISESPFKYQLIGLNLLCLLARNRLSEFHTELELLNPHLIQTNIYIRHPVSLEQYLMEGSYNKVFLSKGNVPSPSYNYFMDILLKTIREEIASCMEGAYKKILFREAGHMLYFKKEEELVEFAKERKWVMASDNYFYFQQKQTDQENQNIPSNELVMQMIEYARELEIIV
ncbi:26S proteasome non-ATPase regulatory subunit 8 [Brachionus plicatilis]|uniref:26S proteasome non-ATPase regulatory subunit 8 n=1 Tax=Brachionus plicatilis TaxID=10195 RepID=A0A3M7P639_BRAPC|nr:26S proteasome non-ATPase regulatory subunit 8 [Brachionus plicatilis]